MEPRGGILRSSVGNFVLAALFILAGGCALKDCIFPPSSRTPAPCNFEECPENTMRYCWNRCVPSRNAGELCSKDPFDCGQLYLDVCSPGLTCEKEPPLGWPLGGWRRDWRCVKRKQFAGVCDPRTDPVCPSGQFCRPTNDPGAPQPSPGVCTNWLRTGEACILESGERFPCEPGLTCVEDVDVVQGVKVVQGVCRKSCQTSADCPCDAGEGDCCEGYCAGTPFASTWEAIQEVIFHQSDCIGCHVGQSAPGDLDLSDSVAYSNLVDKPSSNGQFVRVKRNAPDSSLLYRKISAMTFPCFPQLSCGEGGPMPRGKPGVNAKAVDVLERWIQAGAPQFGLVPDAYLGHCKLPRAPLKVTPLPPPASGIGLQFRPPPWELKTGESEVCFATYYDLTSQVASASPCSNPLGEMCAHFHKINFLQDRFSHHAIIRLYQGIPGVAGSRLHFSAFGMWHCRDQNGKDGMECHPSVAGSAPTGAECGAGQSCSSQVRSSLAGCMDYAPMGSQAIPIGGAAQACARQDLPPDVFGALPLTGILLWESHAINLTGSTTTLEQYFNLEFADPTDHLEATGEFVPNTDLTVEPFKEKTICWTKTFAQPVRVFQLSSHTHKRGKLFRAWAPPNDPCQSVSTCPEETQRQPIYESLDYTSPCQKAVNIPPMGTDVRSLTVKFCATFDNGATDSSKVRKTPCPLQPGDSLACLGGQNEGAPCSSANPNLCLPGGGTCSACPVHWGPTTDDEMMVLIVSYYVP